MVQWSAFKVGTRASSGMQRYVVHTGGVGAVDGSDNVGNVGNGGGGGSGGGGGLRCSARTADLVSPTYHMREQPIGSGLQGQL